MQKIEKLIPDKVQVIGHRVTIPEPIFDSIIKTLNSCTKTINELVDAYDKLGVDVKALATSVEEVRKATQDLAISFQTLMED